MSATARPPDCLSAVSSESVSRVWIPSRTAMRSTTTSMVCFFCLASGGTSPVSYVSPSTRTRTNPCLATSSSSFWYSPLRPRTSGERICTRVRSGSARIWSTI